MNSTGNCNYCGSDPLKIEGFARKAIEKVAEKSNFDDQICKVFIAIDMTLDS